ncbi:unnamed protein product [Amaranthus hypochondriacus]
MRTLCDVCEGAAAIFFCAADEAALCRACDEKVHMCNKLASRHIRVGLAAPTAVPKCDICENAPAFFYCEIDGSSLCLQCDMAVHVGGKRTHRRYLLLRQRAEVCDFICIVCICLFHATSIPIRSHIYHSLSFNN